MGAGVALADLLAEALARPASRRSSCAGHGCSPRPDRIARGIATMARLE
jgi:hypothetical protein